MDETSVNSSYQFNFRVILRDKSETIIVMMQHAIINTVYNCDQKYVILRVSATR